MKEYELWNSETDTGAVAAETGEAFRIEAYQTEDGTLKVYLNHTGVMEQDCYTIQIGNETLEVQDVTTVKAMGEGMTYVCIVDNSGSLDEMRAEQIRTFLTELNQNKEDTDSICLILAGSEIKQSAYQTDAAAIQKEIDAIQPEDAWTNLYKGIDVAVQSLASAKEAHNKKCIVILSDGAEESENGITIGEAYDHIEESHVPVYTVALISDKTELERAKLLGSFARRSGGGKHFTPFVDGTTMEQVSAAIRSDMEQGTVLTVSVDALQEQGQSQTLEVTCQTKTAIYRDMVTDVDRAWISHAQEATGMDAESPEEIVTATATEAGTQNTEHSPVSPLLIGGLAGIVVLVIVLVILLLRRRHAAEECEAEMNIKNNTQESPPVEQKNVQEEGKSKTAAVPDNQKQEKRVSETFHIQMVRLGNEKDGEIEFDIQDSVTIGRGGQSGIKLAKDALLSGEHCRLTRNDSRLYLEDLQSTNGTYVNGVPIRQPMKLEQDDVILIGSYEYRIRYKKK